jgi:hypothetical protein
MRGCEVWEQVGVWTGGTVGSLAVGSIDGVEVWLAATAAGLFRSVDGGRRWQACDDGLDDPAVAAVALAQVGENATVFATTATGRMYRSDDGGKGWSEVHSWAGLGVATVLALSSTFAEDQTIFVGTLEGIYRSLDGGAQWESCTFGLLDSEVLTLACAPAFADSQLVWAGTAGGGLYRSRNGGRAWRESGVGLPDTAIQCLAVSPDFAESQMLAAGTEGYGVYLSSDGGQSWQPCGEPALEQNINSLLFVTGAEGIFLAAGAGEGIAVRNLAEPVWRPVRGGEFVALDLAQGRTGLLAGTFADGVMAGEPEGEAWKPSVAQPAAHAPPLAVLAWKESPVALDRDGVLAAWRGEAMGWTVCGPPDLAAPLTAVATVGNRVYGAACEQTEQLYVAEEAGADGWRNLAGPEGAGEAALLAATEDGVMWASVFGTLYLLRAVESAWTRLARPWEGETLLHAAFAPDFAGPEGLVAVTALVQEGAPAQVSVWQSSDFGRNWTNLAGLETDAPAVLMAVAVGMPALFLATQHRLVGLIREGPDGALRVGQTLFPVGTRVTALAVSPRYAEDTTVMAATSGIVQWSRNGGDRWEPLGSGLDGRPVTALLPTPSDQVYAVTLGGTLWRIG